MPVFEVLDGNSPVVLGIPHTGTFVPPEIWDRLNDNGRLLADTDWHIERLFAGLHPGVGSVRATTHRYVIDANRDPDGSSLYPGQNTTGLFPTTDFDPVPIWKDAGIPSAAETANRIETYHRPYHQALASQLELVRDRHGVAILIDCHSIRSKIPFLFDGILPDLNIGTNSGAACAPAIEEKVMEIVQGSTFSSVLNGRFKGGWTTRHYGDPLKNIHVVQIEIAQSRYLETEAPPFDYSNEKSARLREVLSTIVREMESLAAHLTRKSAGQDR